MGPYTHVSLALLLKSHILFKGIFVDDVSPIIIIKKDQFLMKLVEMRYNFSSFSSSFIFSVITSKYNFSITEVFLLMSKHNDFVKIWQHNLSYVI